MPRLHRSQAPMAGKRRGGIGGAGRDNKGYDYFLDLDGFYSIYVYVRDPGRARKLKARKEAGRMRKDRMGTATL